MHVFYVYNKIELLLSFICNPLQDIYASITSINHMPRLSR